MGINYRQSSPEARTAWFAFVNSQVGRMSTSNSVLSFVAGFNAAKHPEGPVAKEKKSELEAMRYVRPANAAIWRSHKARLDALTTGMTANMVLNMLAEVFAERSKERNDQWAKASNELDGIPDIKAEPPKISVRVEDGCCVGVELDGRPVDYNLLNIENGQEVDDDA